MSKKEYQPKFIYFAASWKHKHAVELLTEYYRERGFLVNSFVELEGQFETSEHGPGISLDQWINSPDGEKCFRFDIDSAMGADLVIYIGPSGTDAWAEVGAAYAKGVPIFALYAKGEQSGLMRRMVSKWFDDYLSCFEASVKLLRP
ncbi:hypothetical protein EHO57_14225, partial [Leptospira langatensis]